ncbi:MAG: hypothetical protein ACI4EX_01860 [Lachnospiraceae bacterium]
MENTIEYNLPCFIFDRTQEDVDRVKELSDIGWEHMTDSEKAEWMSGLKGALNKSDLNRIENNCSIIAQLLGLPMKTYKNEVPDYPTTDYFENLIGNVASIRVAGMVSCDTPAVPDLPLNTWQKVNAVEKILHDVYENYCSGLMPFAGTEVYVGEEIELLL